jgi:glutaryl-CoA dehydrogenase
MGMTPLPALGRLAPRTAVETESAGEEHMAHTDGRHTARGGSVEVAAGLAPRPVRTARRVARLGPELQRVAAGNLGDIEVLQAYEGTATMQALIVGRDITGIGACA